MIQKILNFLTKWDKDKILHFSLSLVVSIVIALIFKFFSADTSTIIASAWFGGFVVGVAKEFYDEYKYKGADEKDWAADLIGTTLGTIITALLLK